VLILSKLAIASLGLAGYLGEVTTRHMKSHGDATHDAQSYSATSAIETPSPVCGNGTVEPGEQCDDGNTTSGDGCSAGCTVEVILDCDDAFVGKACDGDDASGDACTAPCRLAGVVKGHAREGSAKPDRSSRSAPHVQSSDSNRRR
jgi:cysteine-rich repeat protein